MKTSTKNNFNQIYQYLVVKTFFLAKQKGDVIKFTF